MALIHGNEDTPIFSIDRKTPFDQALFHCTECLIKEVSPRASRLEQISMSDLRLGSLHLEPPEPVVELDAKVFETMWKDRARLPKALQRIPAGQSFFQMYFSGTRLVRNNVEHVLYLRWGPNYWLPTGDSTPRWHWGVTALRYEWGYPFPAIFCRC